MGWVIALVVLSIIAVAIVAVNVGYYNGKSESTEKSINGYEQGLQDGVMQGYEKGAQNGFTQGYKEGYEEGSKGQYINMN